MARKVPFAKIKYEERLMQQINVMLRREFSDPRLMLVTVTSVELTSDYSYAKVMWDTFDKSKRGDAKEAIEGIASKLRSKLASVLEVRHTPILKFHYNAQFEAEHHIGQILNREKKLHESDNEDEIETDSDEEE